MKTVFVCNSAEPWLAHGATHFGYKHIPNFDPMFCYTPADATRWAETLGKFVRSLDEEYVLLMLDDYWVQDVELDLFAIAEWHMASGIPHKIDMSGDRRKFPHTEYEVTGLVLSKQEAPYRTSLQAAIWRTDYLLGFCKDGWTPWDFELHGRRLAMNDDAIILGTYNPCLRYINVLRRGEWYGKFDF